MQMNQGSPGLTLQPRSKVCLRVIFITYSRVMDINYEHLTQNCFAFFVVVLRKAHSATWAFKQM